MNASSRIFKHRSRERSPGLRIYTAGKCEGERMARTIKGGPQRREVFLTKSDVSFAHLPASLTTKTVHAARAIEKNALVAKIKGSIQYESNLKTQEAQSINVRTYPQGSFVFCLP
jgi:hypothetical protein